MKELNDTLKLILEELKKINESLSYLNPPFDVDKSQNKHFKGDSNTKPKEKAKSSSKVSRKTIREMLKHYEFTTDTNVVRYISDNEFICNLAKQFDNKKELSEKQVNALDRAVRFATYKAYHE